MLIENLNQMVQESNERLLGIINPEEEKNEVLDENPGMDTGDTRTETLDQTENLDALIENLPDNFPEALPVIQSKIAPVLANCSPGLVEHYVQVIKKKTNASSKRAITIEIEAAGKELYSIDPEVNEEKTDEDEEGEELQKDPDVQEMAEEIGLDPFLFKKRIDLVNILGVVGERKPVGLYLAVMDSRLLPMGSGGSDALALKNSGHFGAGKSFPMFMCLRIYPKLAYHLITGGSPKSLYNLEDGLKHRVLILTEALHLEADNRGDNELAYSIRSLVSEGNLKYQYTGYNEKGKRATIIQELKGPTSLLTTTVRGKLEAQLEDRLITVHPNTSSKQTQDILTRTADQVAGARDEIDDKTIAAWKLFHQSLESVEVVIPFARDIAYYVNQNGSLPISARRAFKRVLSLIKTVALLYQQQRERDQEGRIITQMSDYAIAFQLIDESFRESLGEQKRYTDQRIKVIEKEGPIAFNKLAIKEGVTVPALSAWAKPKIERGLLIWCDENGREFPDQKTLEKAKHSGKAFIKVAYPCGLPTPYQLSGDPGWDKGGESYKHFDLGLGNTIAESDVLMDKEEFLAVSDSSINENDIETGEKSHYVQEGIKVLEEKPDECENKSIPKQEEWVSKIDGINWEGLGREFGEILSSQITENQVHGTTNWKAETLSNGILTI